jgi:hypothetical protein
MRYARAGCLFAEARMTAYALDHVFLCCSRGGAEAKLLLEAGLSEGSPNSHPGQGTCCRRFFFANAFLELLWISDPGEATSETSSPTRLFERWRRRSTNTSPIGICLRPAANPAANPAVTSAPFETWAYAPPYLPPGLSIDMAVGAPLAEPEMFFTSFGKRPDARAGAAREPIVHALGLSELTSVTVTSSSRARLSTAARRLVETGLVGIDSGEADCLVLGFDHERSSRSLDFRPQLPLILRH